MVFETAIDPDLLSVKKDNAWGVGDRLVIYWLLSTLICCYYKMTRHEGRFIDMMVLKTVVFSDLLSL